jgi:hypothetical protein
MTVKTTENALLTTILMDPATETTKRMTSISTTEDQNDETDIHYRCIKGPKWWKG